MIDNAWFYAGFVEYPQWGITRRQGQHEALIDMPTYHGIQGKFTVRSYVMNRSLTKQKFYLRGIAYCAECKKRMYGSYAGGRNSKYGYYYCNTHGCSQRRVSTRLETFHRQFEHFLMSLQPSLESVDAFERFAQQASEQQEQLESKSHNALLSDIAKLEKEESMLVEKLAQTTSKGVEKAIMKRIEHVETEKAELNERLERGNMMSGGNVTPIADIQRVGYFFRNLMKCWESSGYEGKRAILNGLFGNELFYCTNERFRNRGNPLLQAFRDGYFEANTCVVERTPIITKRNRKIPKLRAIISRGLLFI